ncbi:MAG: hypothetical protein IKY78_10765 [Clostridia bacterium]|nr:hypothetical protein [Clostridia bacterium]
MEFYERFDTIVGTVTGCSAYGAFVKDDETGEEFFYFGNGRKGDRVQLSVKRIDLEKKRITCRLDSVLEYADSVA